MDAHLLHLVGAYIFGFDRVRRRKRIMLLLRIFSIQPAPCSAVTVAARIEILGYEVLRFTIRVSLCWLGNHPRKRCDGRDISRGFPPHLPARRSTLVDREPLYLWRKSKAVRMFSHDLVDILRLLAVGALAGAQIF